MTSVLDPKLIKKELSRFMRNNDVFSTTTRGVTTGTTTGTYSSASTHLIAIATIKNIRSIVVGGVTLTYGTDYEYQEDYSDAGTLKCKITYVSAQTGDYTVTYDSGADKIYPDLPQETLSISQFPRIGIEMIGEDSEDSDADGSVELTTITFSIYVYDQDADNIDDYIKVIKQKFIANKKSFYNLRYVRKIRVGPLLPFPPGKRKVFFKAVDFISPLNEESV